MKHPATLHGELKNQTSKIEKTIEDFDTLKIAQQIGQLNALKALTKTDGLSQSQEAVTELIKIRTEMLSLSILHLHNSSVDMQELSERYAASGGLHVFLV